MKQRRNRPVRIMAITPSTRGFGYAVIDQGSHLVDWGAKRVRAKEKNPESLSKAEQLIAQYLPSKLVMWQYKGTRRAERIQNLSDKIVAAADARKIRVSLFSRQQVNQAFGLAANDTKLSLAGAVAKLFPEELGRRLPPDRKAWMPEDARLDFFDAVALTLLWLSQNAKRLSKATPKQS